MGFKKPSAACRTVGAPVHIQMWGPFAWGGGEYRIKISDCDKDFWHIDILTLRDQSKEVGGLGAGTGPMKSMVSRWSDISEYQN